MPLAINDSFFPCCSTHLLCTAAATTLTTRAMGDSVGATCLEREPSSSSDSRRKQQAQGSDLG